MNIKECKNRIKFRARRKSDEKWVYGYFYRRSRNPLYLYIIRDNEDVDHMVDGSTVWQYTGFKDKNGKEIYEGMNIEGLLSFYNNTRWDPTYRRKQKAIKKWLAAANELEKALNNRIQVDAYERD